MREQHAERMDGTGSTTARPAGFVGAGEMGERVRVFDWTATSLGPIERWPPALRTIVRTVLEAPFPVSLWCGTDLRLIYNDAYRRVLGAKHPSALGRPGSEVWAEVWPSLAPMLARISAGGPPVYEEEMSFQIERAGVDGGAGEREEVWFSFSFSAIRDEASAVIAFLNIVSEMTGRMLAERRLRALHHELEVERSRLAHMFQKSPSMLAVLRGPAFVFTYVNDAYLQLVGQRELLGKTLKDAVPEVVEQGHLPLLEQVMATGEPFLGREMPIRLARTRGAPLEERYLDFVYQPFVEVDGTRSGVIVHGTDVTDHVRTRSAVERLMAAERAAREEAERARADAEAAREAAETAAQVKADFLTTMSH
ncbi:MAG TPA: PAS domain-containing protein, partial [Gemmatimonadaceae bacterium]|nr:PAS domain-containing protein [Gemmatimonadaceae bacterium]